MFAHIGRIDNKPPVKFFPYKTFVVNTGGGFSGVALFIKPWLRYTPVKHNLFQKHAMDQ